MRTSLLIAAISLFAFAAASGQDNRLIYPSRNITPSERTILSHTLRQQAMHRSGELVQVDLEKLHQHKTLSLAFDGRDLTVSNLQMKRRRNGNRSWMGRSVDSDGYIVLSASSKDIQGTISVGPEVYQLRTLAPETYAIVKIDQSAYPPEICPKPTPSSRMEFERPDDTDKPRDTHPSKRFQLPLEPYSCALRLLVLYTPAARTGASDIGNTIQLAVEETNFSFLASGIGHSVELAYVGETAYAEVDAATDQQRFATDGDQFMDEVHTLRNTYDADICVLITDTQEYCGTALTVQAAEDEAFCLVSYQCATGNYSFAHEIGHLLGCLHDTYTDGSNGPYPYGHGYINPEKGWRTIMAYDDLCADIGQSCTRILHWSNPSVTYNGDPTGTIENENCARIWNDFAEAPMGFRESDDQLILQSGDLSSADYANLLARQTISTQGPVIVPGETLVHLRASEKITFSAGFSTQAGAELSAAIDPVSDCGGDARPNLACIDGGVLSVEGNTLGISDIEVANNGYSDAGASAIGYYFSINPTFSTEFDYLIGESEIPALQPGESWFPANFSIDLGSIFLPDGDYYLGLILDHRQEVSESNGPDNTDCYWGDVVVTLNNGISRPNLACLDRGTLQVNGSSLQISDYTVTNTGDYPAGSFHIGYYLSSDTNFDPNTDFLLGESQVGELASGATSVESFAVHLDTLPIPNGTYFVGTILDYLGEVAESDGLDNDDCFWETPTVTIPSVMAATSVPDHTNATLTGKTGGHTIDPSTSRESFSTASYEMSLFPNPTRDQGFITFSLPKADAVSLSIRDLQGRALIVLLDREPKPAGTYQLSFGTETLSAGLYLCTLQTSTGQLVSKLAVIAH